MEYSSQRRARAIADAVGVEAGSIADSRSRATLTHEDATVRITVEARDLATLRAGVNTWLRLVRTAEETASAAADAG